ncbi:MAG: hypothetical protein ACM359_14435 [Bacillota bacterium]
MRRVPRLGSLWTALRPVLKGIFETYRRRVPLPVYGIEPLEERQLLSDTMSSTFTPYPNGTDNDIAFDSQGNLHIAYYDTSTKELKYAIRHADGYWFKEQTIDSGLAGGEGDGGRQISIAIDKSDRPGVAYVGYENGTKKLKYVRRNSDGSWGGPDFIQVNSNKLTGEHPSLVFSQTTTAPFISYYDPGTLDLKYTFYSEELNQWNDKVVDTAGDVGSYSSIAINPNTGRPAIAYADDTLKRLKYWEQTSATASSTKVFNGSGDTYGKVVCMSLSYQQISSTPGVLAPAISYCDDALDDLRYVQRSGSNPSDPWAAETIVSSGTTGWYSNLLFPRLHTSSDYPTIVYYDVGRDQSQIACKIGGVWQVHRPTDGFNCGSLMAADNATNGNIAFSNLQTGNPGLYVYLMANAGVDLGVDYGVDPDVDPKIYESASVTLKVAGLECNNTTATYHWVGRDSSGNVVFDQSGLLDPTVQETEVSSGALAEGEYTFTCDIQDSKGYVAPMR